MINDKKCSAHWTAVRTAVFFLLWVAVASVATAGAPNRDLSADQSDLHMQPQPAPKGTGVVAVTVQDAILMALENNRELAVERIRPSIQETFEQQERAVFDPIFRAHISRQKERGERARATGGRDDFDADTVDGEVAVETFFPTGTTMALGGRFERLKTSANQDPFSQSRLGVSVTQALLRGFGVAVNLANIRQSRLDTKASLYELRGFSESLVSRVESAYWDYALANRQIVIVEESLQLAEQQKKEAEEMIEVGQLGESEIVAAQAEIASRRQDLIEARSALDVNRLRLLRFLNPPGAEPFQREVVLRSQPDLQHVSLDGVEDHVALALKMRPDLNQARLEVERGDIEIVKTRNGTLPKMDLFIDLGNTRYADSFTAGIGGDSHDTLVGIRLEYPLFNRAADAGHRRSLLNRDQARRALENLSQLVELDVRTAYIEVERARQQITASSETRKLEEEKLRVETEKFRVGRSTNFLVAQAQRDFLLSQLVEVRSVASYLKALTELFRLEGSLLDRRGISAPDGRLDLESGSG